MKKKIIIMFSVLSMALMILVLVSCEKKNHTHTVVTDDKIEQTCTKIGKTEGSHCSECGEIIVAQEEIPPTGHNETVITEGVAPTCTSEGMTPLKECSVCKTIISAAEKIPKIAHTETVLTEKVEPTCTQIGMTESVHCSVCKTVLSVSEMIAAKGHTEFTLSAVEPTCLKDGKTAGVKCSDCNKIISGYETIKAPGEHTFKNGDNICSLCGFDASNPSPDDEDESKVEFTVTVTLNGSNYTPSSELPVKAVFLNETTMKIVDVGSDGTAKAKLDDGTYMVRLTDIPNAYTYNPNAVENVSTSDPSVSVELLPITETYGNGASLYNCIKLQKEGVYRATFDSNSSVVYYEFTPTAAGVYYFESILDVSLDIYNPIITPYAGTAVKYPQSSVDGGGVSGEYTKNFMYKLDVSKDMVGQSKTISIEIESKNEAKYPMTVDFFVSYSDFEVPDLDEPWIDEDGAICGPFIPLE